VPGCLVAEEGAAVGEVRGAGADCLAGLNAERVMPWAWARGLANLLTDGAARRDRVVAQWAALLEEALG
jgi:hypothetical protein